MTAAVPAAKKANGWRYPALSEIYAVMKSLGYAKRTPPEDGR